MALFKMYNNIDSNNALPSTYTKGYMYFDVTKSLFYIDTAGEGGSSGTRVALNSYGAQKAYSDENDDRISTTYLKVADASSITAARVAHKLTFGANGEYEYDGSADVTVPVYTGGVV